MPSGHILSLPNGRKLHYAASGSSYSNIVVIFFPGILIVGTVPGPELTGTLGEKDVHYLSLSLPGNGQSSSTPKNTPYHINLCRLLSFLLEHLHPADGSKDNVIEKIYLGGGSYGSAPCQMVYGASTEIFSLADKICGMLLLAPFSPFKLHGEYTKHMTWANWISVGPPSQVIPMRGIPRLISTAMASKCKDIAGARSLLDMALFSKMDPSEKQRFEDFARSNREITGDDLKNEMAQSTLDCSINWDGLIEGSDVLHSDWGFEPSKLNFDGSSRRPNVVIAYGEGDDLGPGMSNWLADQYANSKLRVLDGGHLAALYHLDEMWDLLFRNEVEYW